ncbi:hypothetical protein COU59_00060 [Candidatus Pacearchaeota archaeon CG10_big_fil_rev_8_21_14_0_10_34_12]|nr:MAG: hypothetical protein COU59_00060 [Candidatus Pacearchaeota archaeon CG10_big_fil_rev_8_21_14_0_10_34_12]
MALSFMTYDIIFLVIFAVFLSVFLYTKRKNLKKDGLLFLYRTKWGIKMMDFVGKKHPKTFSVLSYISISTGYILMISVVYLLGRIVYLYATLPSLVKAIKVPPILPLFPYVNKIIPDIGLPNFYFTYFIIIIAVIAISHEFSHGIFMRRYNIKIKSTGFAFFPWFLPIFPAAFVEQDEKSMTKSKKFEQMAVLSAGTFANILTAILFFGVLWIFFATSFSASGVSFDAYPYSAVNSSSITMVNGILIDSLSFNKIINLTKEEGLNKISANGRDYVATRDSLEKQWNDQGYIILYYDGPAINAHLENVIMKVNGEKIMNVENLQKKISEHSPSEIITLTVLGSDGEIYDKDIVLGKNPENESSAWLGIAFLNPQSSTILGKVSSKFSFKEPHIYYTPDFEAGLFIYNLLWWLILISISVALVNMLPVGIFDGGRFFYLTALAITKSEKVAKKLFKFSTYLFLFAILILMLFWAASLF